MLTNFIILVLSFLGFANNTKGTKPPNNGKPGIEIPKPTSYGNEKTGHKPGGGWDLN